MHPFWKTPLLIDENARMSNVHCSSWKIKQLMVWSSSTDDLNRNCRTVSILITLRGETFARSFAIFANFEKIRLILTSEKYFCKNSHTK